MKKTILSIAVLCVFAINSCKKDELLAPTNQINENKIIDFQGERLLLSDEISEEDVSRYLNFSIEDSNKKLRTNSENEIDWSKVPSDVFLKILYSTYAKYIDVNKEKFTDADFDFIKKGLPDIKDKEEASTTKKHIVVDYFEILMGNEIRKEVKLFLKSNKGLRPDNLQSYQSSYNALNPTEQSCAANHPVAAVNVQTARTQAINTFGNHNDNTVTNARFHAFWSAGMVKEICHSTLNKWKGLDRGKIFATAHEYDTNQILNCANDPNHVASFGVRNYGLCNYMDLNNNLVGRTYMYNTVGQTWLGNANNIPSYASILTYVNGLSSTLKTTTQQILGMSSSYSMDTIGHYLDAMDYHTPTADQLVNIQ